jgi:glycosyltransferase involved in cell wall biosynthesis
MQPESEFAGEREGYIFPANVVVHTPDTHKPPKSAFRYLGSKLGQAVHSRVLRRNWKEPASSVILNTHHIVRDILRANHIDVVVFTELSSLALAPLVRRLSLTAVRIMDMHNVDHVLIEQELAALSRPDASTRTRFLRTASQLREREAGLFRNVEMFWTTSEQDRYELNNLNGGRIPGFVVPNGVDVEMRPFDSRAAKASSRNVLFCGSLDYLPNRDGLRWFYNEIWPKIRNSVPDARLTVVGRGAVESEFESMRSDASVEFQGEVQDVLPYYRAAGVAVVPLRLGSGTRLKIPEAMSLGNPVVSTSLGAMGLTVTNGADIAIADDATEFASDVVRLMTEPDRFHSVRNSARKLVDENYDWRVIGQKINHLIGELVPNDR